MKKIKDFFAGLLGLAIILAIISGITGLSGKTLLTIIFCLFLVWLMIKLILFYARGAEKKAPSSPPEIKYERVKSFSEKPKRIFTKVVGVSYNNEDGSSRQQLLAGAKEMDDTEARLIPYLFKGEQAIAVAVSDGTIGNVPRGKIDEIMDVFDSISSSTLNIECFETEEGNPMYRADLLIEYE